VPRDGWQAILSNLGMPGFDSRVWAMRCSGSRPYRAKPWTGQPHADDNIVSTDYIDNGIAALEDFLAEASLVTV